MDELSSCLLDGYGVLPSAPTNLRFSNVETNFGILHWDAPEKLAESVFQYVVSYQVLQHWIILKGKFEIMRWNFWGDLNFFEIQILFSKLKRGSSHQATKSRNFFFLGGALRLLTEHIQKTCVFIGIKFHVNNDLWDDNFYFRKWVKTWEREKNSTMLRVHSFWKILTGNSNDLEGYSFSSLACQ